jgi:hypothetical protein
LAQTQALFSRVQTNTKATCIFEEFEGKHHFPVTTKYLQRFSGLLGALGDRVGSLEAAKLQSEELEVLQSIYGEESVEVLRPAPSLAPDACFQLKITLSPDVAVLCTALQGYPVSGRMEFTVFAPKLAPAVLHSLRAALTKQHNDMPGEMCVFACIAAFQEALLLPPPVEPASSVSTLLCVETSRQ